MGDLKRIHGAVKKFIDARDWDQFHSPKNLAISISIEAAELLEHFQWHERSRPGERKYTKEERLEIEREVADITAFLLRFVDVMGIDLEKAVLAKLRHNAKKYPVRLVRGKSNKYTHYRKLKKAWKNRKK